MDPFMPPLSPPSPYPPSSPRLSSSSYYYLPPASTSYQPSMSSTVIPSRPYISPHLSYQFDSLTTTSPALLQNSMLPMHEDQHLIVHEYGPQEGSQGAQIAIKCDVNFPATPPPSHAESSSLGPLPVRSSAGKALRVVFGQHPVQTTVHLLMAQARIGPGQLCQLTATVPSWSSTGAAGMGRSNRVPVYVQVLAETHAIVETVMMGEFAYTSTGPRGERLVM
jgi:hypothetical protein